IADSCMRRIRLAFNAATLPPAGTHNLGIHVRDIAGRAIVPTGSPDHFDVTISTDTIVPTATFGGAPVFGNPPTPTPPSFILAQQVRIVFSTAMRSAQDGFDPSQAANTAGNYTL